MSGYRDLNDWNFDGWSNGELAAEISRLSSGDLARKFSTASDALRELAGTLKSVDEELRLQLKDLGINWQGAAGEEAQGKTKATTEVVTDAGDRTVENSNAMARQQESTTQARYNTPEEHTLRGDTEKNLGDKLLGVVGYETDHAAEVAATNKARQEAIDGLKGYVNGSQGALNDFRPPQPAPDIVVSSSAVSTPVGPTVGLPNSGPPGVTGSPGFTGTPGSPGSPGVPVGPTPNIPGGTTGILPGNPTPGPIAAGPGLPKPFGSPLPVAATAATAAAAGLAGAAGNARGPQVVGGGRGPSQAPKTPIAPAGPKGAPSTIGAGGKGGPGAGGGAAGAGAGGAGAAGKGVPGTMTPGGATGVGPDANRPGAAGAKGGVPAGKGAGSLMSPAAGVAKGEGDEDTEHVRKYGVDSDDVFGDERMVVQSVIGEEPKDK